jgi:glycerol-3-phosphate dehydrogenase
MFDVTIIGAGIVGCAAARELTRYNLSICVVDMHDDVACGTTKANSAIVHAGFDASPGSLKAQLNGAGNNMFDKLSKELDFPFKRNGSLVLCFNKDELYKLEALKKQGEENGVSGICILSSEETKKLEPNISDAIAGALYAPTGGITCPYEMTIAYAENAFTNGAKFMFDTEVTDIKRIKGYYKMITSQGDIESRLIINAAGIYADEINNMVSSKKMHIIPRKGEYCLFDKAAGGTVSKTIFQLPTAMGKGVLVTPTVDGNLLVGPNAVDIDKKSDINTTSEGIDEVLRKAKKSVKDIPMNQIITSFSGLRAHADEDDFIIGEADGADKFINAAGIESPGLSSAPAIADMLLHLVIDRLKPEKNENFNPIRKGIPKFREMDNERRKELIAENPDYGKIICRCETVTEGEIINAIRRPLGAKTIDGVKRRTRAGMGRCQSGFCLTRVVDILARELNVPRTEITKFGGNSNILVGKNKQFVK